MPKRGLSSSTPAVDAVASQPGNPATGVGSKRVAVSANSAPAKPRYVRIITEKRREQCRRSQSKYRRKQMQMEVDIEISVQRLRVQVLQLEDQRRTLCHAVNSRDFSVRLLAEFCSVFRHGVRVADSSPAQRSQDRQLAFVKNHLHHTVRVDDSRGDDVFMQQMRLFSTFYKDLLVELLYCSDLNVLESSMTIKAHQQLQLTVSDTTIRSVFPHLQRPEHYLLRSKLLGVRLRLPLCALFVFDEAGTVLELDWIIDFIGALQQIELTVEEIAFVLQQAQIVRDSYLVDKETPSGDVVQSSEKDETEDHTSEVEETKPRRSTRWYEDKHWRQAQTDEYSERDQAADGEGYLIHDGKGDDYMSWCEYSHLMARCSTGPTHQ